MDNVKTGELIRRLRKERNMTQLQLAEKLCVSDKAVSKWERGLGAPEVSLVAELSKIFEVDMENLFAGELNKNKVSNGNMRRMKFYVCPHCGNIVTSMAETSATCCGRKLKELTPVKAEEKLNVEIIDNEYFVSRDHEMTREHYIAFVAVVTADTILMKKQYPEWDLQVRLPYFARGRLMWYCTKHGLFYQELGR